MLLSRVTYHVFARSFANAPADDPIAPEVSRQLLDRPDNAHTELTRRSDLVGWLKFDRCHGHATARVGYANAADRTHLHPRRLTASGRGYSRV